MMLTDHRRMLTSDVVVVEQMNVGMLKGKIEEIVDVDASRQRLLHGGRELVDDATPESLGWGSRRGRERVVLHMVTTNAPQRPRGGRTFASMSARRTQPPRGGAGAGAGEGAGGAGGGGGEGGEGGEGGGRRGQPIAFDLSSILPPEIMETLQGDGSEAEMVGPFTMQIPNEGENEGEDGGGGGGPQSFIRRMMEAALSSQNSTVAPPIQGRLLNGRSPQLGEDGTLATGLSIDVLDRMLQRLEREDTEQDSVPSLQRVTLEQFRDADHARPWGVAIRQFLETARRILQDFRLNRETRAVVNRTLRQAGLDSLPLGVHSFPVSTDVVMSDEEDESREGVPVDVPVEEESVETGAAQAQDGMGQSDAQGDYSWVAGISHEDLIVVAAVTIGELTRRFMRVTGQASSPTASQALIIRAADRLCSLSSIPEDIQELRRQIRLVASHFCRVAVSAAELGRSMTYLSSALGDANMFLFQLYPGYIEMQEGLPRPNLGILHNIEAHRLMSMIPNLPGMPHGPVVGPGPITGIMSMSFPMPRAFPNPRRPAQGRQDTEAGQQQRGQNPPPAGQNEGGRQSGQTQSQDENITAGGNEISSLLSRLLQIASGDGDNIISTMRSLSGVYTYAPNKPRMQSSSRIHFVYSYEINSIIILYFHCSSRFGRNTVRDKGSFT